MIVIDIKMPKSCKECQYIEYSWNRPLCHAKSQQGRKLPQKELYRTRAQFCPLVEKEDEE